MRFFGSNPKRSASNQRPSMPQVPPDDPHPVMRLLSCEDVARLIALFRDEWAQEGVEMTYHEDGYFLDAEGRSYGLANLSATLSQTDRNEWPNIVRANVRSMVAAYDTQIPETLGQARQRLFFTLRQNADLPWPSVFPFLTPELRISLVLDYPSHVVDLTDENHINQLGGWEVVSRIAIENLAKLPVAHEQVLLDESVPDSVVYSFVQEDFFGAARILVVDQLLSEFGIERPSHGILFSIPDRHTLTLHVINGEGVVPALKMLVPYTVDQHFSNPGAISPNVYYRSAEGIIEQISSVETNEQGQPVVRVKIEGSFARALEAVGAQ